MNTFRNIGELYRLRPETCEGFSKESLLQAEKRLQTTLPETFRKYYSTMATTSEDMKQNTISL